MANNLTLESLGLNYREFLDLSPPRTPGKGTDECLPVEKLQEGMYIGFKVNGKVIFPINKLIPLKEEGREVAIIQIDKYTHFKDNTTGKYRVKKIG